MSYTCSICKNISTTTIFITTEQDVADGDNSTVLLNLPIINKEVPINANFSITE